MEKKLINKLKTQYIKKIIIWNWFHASKTPPKDFFAILVK
jgi:hypothetical protein